MIDFNKIIERITPLLNEYNFSIVENYKYHIKYESKVASILVGYDERERIFFTILGDKSNIFIPLDVNNLISVFDYDTERFIRKPFEDFFIDFFTTKGNPILSGDKSLFRILKKDREQRAEEYTIQLLRQQYLYAADKAWLSNKYNEFVRHLDLIDKSSLPKSYELKYSIAKKK